MDAARLAFFCTFTASRPTGNLSYLEAALGSHRQRGRREIHPHQKRLSIRSPGSGAWGGGIRDAVGAPIFLAVRLQGWREWALFELVTRVTGDGSRRPRGLKCGLIRRVHPRLPEGARSKGSGALGRCFTFLSFSSKVGVWISPRSGGSFLTPFGRRDPLASYRLRPIGLR